jgi:hypothetical protein
VRGRPAVQVVDGMKHCSACGTPHPVEEFHRDSSTATGLTSACRRARAKYGSGARDPEKRRRVEAAYRERNRDAIRERGRKRWRTDQLPALYGITVEQYDEMIARQQGKCAICSYEPAPGERRLSVDHDHGTGAVRALLCGRCNVALGMLREDPDLIRAAAEYLEAHQR